MSLRSFSLKMFQHCPLLASFSVENHIRAFEEFMQYKTRVPVRGAVMLNDNMDTAVLVRGYKKGASWSFPRGKINKDEDDLDCAVREVYEETGYDLREAGLIERNEPVHPLEVTMHDQQVRLYVFRGIPEDTIFETRTRKEIGAIRWYKVSDLPAYRKKRNAGRNNGADGPSNDKFYMVAPFMVQLRQWVMKQKKLDARKAVESGGHLYPHVLYEENLTDDNVIHEVHEPVEASPAQATHPEYIDSATKELHRLLKVKPPTQGLQIPPPSSNQQSGSALMSLLQPKVASGEQMPNLTQGVPHTPYDHTYTEAPQPHAPHHHHPTQRMPGPNYGVPPQFPIPTDVPDMGYSQHRARARVDIDTNVHIPHGSNMTEQPRQFAPQQVPLVHPQPLPPQVQKAMLLRTFATTPQIKGPNTHQPGPSGFSQENQQFAHSGQVHHLSMQGVPVEKRLPAQLPMHSANLLNVLKGNVNQANADQHRGPISPQHIVELPAEQIGQHQFSQPRNEFANQYGNPAMPSGFNAAPGNSIAAASSSVPHPTRPTDKHRVGLLDMFKRAESPVAQGQVDGVDTARRSSQPGAGEKRQQWVDQSPSTAGALRASAKENGRPIQMNPETNLPFGALTILSRPQANKSPAAGSTVSGGRNTIDTTRYSARGSQHSPRSTFTKGSPSLSRASPRSYQQSSQMQHQLSQASPRSYGSYPYGGAPQGNVPNPLSLLPGPPSASTLPVPSGTQPRRESTTEQRNTLLSLFGKPRSSFDQGKGKEPALADHFGLGSTPRSRLGSVASSGGDSAIPTTLRSNASRRSSQAPLSSADTDFLLNFLGNASSSARR